MSGLSAVQPSTNLALPAAPPSSTPRFEPTAKWVRVAFGGAFIADSKRAMLLWEPPRPTPAYYFPKADVRADVLEPSPHSRPSLAMGDAVYWSLRLGDRIVENAVWAYTDPPSGAPDTRDYLSFKWDAVDAWYEEDEEVFVHPRDPHHRVDIVESSRDVRVVVAGVTVADTVRPRLLFETGLPVRYYIPKLDVRMELLTESTTVTQCPYKGMASHWHYRNADVEEPDIAWTYHLPTAESAKIADLVAFYNERVEAIYVDGELQPVPQTPWARARS